MLYKYGKRTRNFWVVIFSFLYFGGVFNKTTTSLALVGYELIIANYAPR